MAEGKTHKINNKHTINGSNKKYNEELLKKISELESANEEINRGRKAALNLMEDAILVKEALQKSEEKYLSLFTAIDQGCCIIEVLFDTKNVAVDYRFLEINPVFEKQTGLTNAVGKSMKQLKPENEESWFKKFGEVAKTGKSQRFEQYSTQMLGGAWFEIFAFRIGPERKNLVAVLFDNITERKAAAEAIRQSEEQFRKAIEQAPVPIVIYTRDGTILQLNNKFTEITGLGRHQVPDFSTLSKFIYGAGAASLKNHFKNSFWNKNQKLNTEFYIITARGEPRYWHFFASLPGTLRNGKQLVVGMAIDITERKLAEEALKESEERLRITTESALDYSIITMDNKRIITGWSRGAELTFQYTAKEAIGKIADIIFTDEDRAAGAPEKEMEAASEKGKAEDERWHQRKDGSRFFMSGVMRPIYDGKLTGYVKVARDMTQQKLLDQQKEDFIGIASHELKTPVTSIKAYTELLQDMCREGDYVSGISLVNKLGVQVDRLIDLVRDLLDMTKIAEGELPLHLENFELHKLIEECKEDMQRTTANHKIVTASKDKINVQADRERINQVLTNLISNSIKYSPKGGTITVGYITTDCEIQIAVQDEGIGISENVKAKIFERFFRANDVQVSTYPGMGLGLYITANIIHRHGGRIWVESSPGEGSIFYFTIPKENTGDLNIKT